MPNKQIPNIVIGRLPQYLRSLQRMMREGRTITSSQELGERLGISAAQIRKDLSQFGEFGKQGTGYSIPYLAEQIQKILHVDHEWEIVIVGAGDMGSAIARYKGFTDRGFVVKAIYDNDPDKIGTQVGSFTVHDIRNLGEEIRKQNIRVAMIAAPANFAQSVADQLVEAGILAILNYAPISLTVPPHVQVQYIDPSNHLQRMTYYLE